MFALRTKKDQALIEITAQSEMNAMLKKKPKKTSLRKLLRPNLNQLPSSTLKTFDATSEIAELRHCIQHSSTIKWEKLRKEILEQFENLLDTPLQSVLTRAWNKCGRVEKIISEQIDSGTSSTSIVPLRSHQIRSQQLPQLTLEIENCKKTKLPLTVVLELSLSKVVLKVQHGEIKSIMSGICEGSGYIQYDDIALANRKIMKFHLSEHINKEEEISLKKAA